MTSLAFHPGFYDAGAAGFGKFYTITTEPNGAAAIDFGSNGDHQDVVKEWTLANPNANTWGAPGDSVRELFRVGQPGQPHNTVDLAFGPDEMLYVSTGDGGFNTFESQDTGTIFGTVFRIDPLNTTGAGIDRPSDNGQYGIPGDNPFVDDTDALGEVYAYGFRSPFRMNFDRQTGDLWIGDVGQSNIEEVSLVAPGGNHGWNMKEGSFRSGQGQGCCRVEEDTPARNGGMTLTDEFGLTDPIFEYDHDDGVTVIGGFVYRGSGIPELQGKYIFADLGEGQPDARLFYGDPDTGEVSEFAIDPQGDVFLGRLGPETGTFLPLPERIISIGEDEDGELLLAAVGIDPRQGGGLDGMLVRILRSSVAGDYNGDGFVGQSDLDLVLLNWGETVLPGGFDENALVGGGPFDGLVSQNELDGVLLNWGGGVLPSASVVPEPSTGGLIAVSSSLLTLFRRRPVLNS